MAQRLQAYCLVLDEQTMKRLINILILLILPFLLFATAQAGDRLIWNGDTLNIFSNPLELRNDIDSLRSKLFGKKENGFNTGCWRGYIAEWTIIENEIYLTNITSCINNYSTKSDLGAVFGAEYENGKVKANWMTGKIIIPKGEIIHEINDAYSSIYETELVLTFDNGILTDQKTYDNSKSYKSRLTENQDSLQEFIYTNIDWHNIPDLKDEALKVYISVQTGGETSKPENITIIRGTDNKLLNQEALRVINLIPEWDVYYKRGEVFNVFWTIPVIFNEQRRKKYAR